VIALTGANMEAKVDGKSVPCWRAIEIKAGSVLKLGAARGAGTRAYLAIRGGLDVAEYLGSRSTFMLGKFGGHAGRALVAGDVLHVCKWNGSRGTALELSQEQIPTYAKEWSIGVLFGPHTAPEFFTEPDIEMLFSTDWRVHYQSDRTGVRLLGPKPVWSRPDGGEAGLHPSNIHDNAYAVGAIDFTGDMPILLGPARRLWCRRSYGSLVSLRRVTRYVFNGWHLGTLKRWSGRRRSSLELFPGGFQN
jgi:urea carboxylase